MCVYALVEVDKSSCGMATPYDRRFGLWYRENWVGVGLVVIFSTPVALCGSVGEDGCTDLCRERSDVAGKGGL
jgi:hypothetical protein